MVQGNSSTGALGLGDGTYIDIFNYAIDCLTANEP